MRSIVYELNNMQYIVRYPDSYDNGEKHPVIICLHGAGTRGKIHVLRDHSLFKIGPFTNRTLNLAALASTLLVALVLFTPVSAAFGLIYLPAKLYLIGLGLILVPLVVMELTKALGIVVHPSVKK